MEDDKKGWALQLWGNIACDVNSLSFLTVVKFREIRNVQSILCEACAVKGGAVSHQICGLK